MFCAVIYFWPTKCLRKNKLCIRWKRCLYCPFSKLYWYMYVRKLRAGRDRPDRHILWCCLSYGSKTEGVWKNVICWGEVSSRSKLSYDCTHTSCFHFEYYHDHFCDYSHIIRIEYVVHIIYAHATFIIESNECG